MNTWLKAMRKGQQDFQRRKLTEAVRQFRAATRIDPGRAEGWVNLGVAQMESGQLTDALASLQRAVARNPRLMQAHLALGDTMRLSGRLEDAIAAFDKAVALQRTPEGLNKLACALRAAHRPAEAETLYYEAQRMRPDFMLAKVNLATLSVELGRFEEAERRMQALAGAPLSPQERAELDTTSAALHQYLRVKPAVQAVIDHGDLQALFDALAATPPAALGVDTEIVDGILRYVKAAERLPGDTAETCPALPVEWPLIEALFMIPYVESPARYREVRKQLETGADMDGNLHESMNMAAVVDAARRARQDLSDPVRAEMHLRHWHALATRGVANMDPGQFKATRNLVMARGYARRAEPHLVTGTLRHYFGETYPGLAPGLSRGLVTMMAISDIHPFADGNGRLAQTLLNRELEWAGQMPLLFTRALGIAGGRFTQATHKMRENRGTMLEVADVVRQGQQFARDFLAALAASDNATAVDRE